MLVALGCLTLGIALGVFGCDRLQEETLAQLRAEQTRLRWATRRANHAQQRLLDAQAKTRTECEFYMKMSRLHKEARAILATRSVLEETTP